VVAKRAALRSGFRVDEPRADFAIVLNTGMQTSVWHVAQPELLEGVDEILKNPVCKVGRASVRSWSDAGHIGAPDTA
jgi:hypothetical protein